MIQSIITKMKIMRDTNTFLFFSTDSASFRDYMVCKTNALLAFVAFSLGSGKVHVCLKELWSGDSQVWLCPPNILSVGHRKEAHLATGTSKTSVPDRHLTALPVCRLCVS